MDWHLEPLPAGYLQTFQEILQSCNLPFEDLHAGMSLFLWRKGTAIGGTAALEKKGTDALLRSLSLKEAFRGQGYGGLLLAAIEDEARRMGIATLFLLTNTAESFFSHQGYSITTRDQVPLAIRQTSEFESVCPASATCMVKVLNSI